MPSTYFWCWKCPTCIPDNAQRSSLERKWSAADYDLHSIGWNGWVWPAIFGSQLLMRLCGSISWRSSAAECSSTCRTPCGAWEIPARFGSPSRSFCSWVLRTGWLQVGMSQNPKEYTKRHFKEAFKKEKTRMLINPQKVGEVGPIARSFCLWWIFGIYAAARSRSLWDDLSRAGDWWQDLLLYGCLCGGE